MNFNFINSISKNKDLNVNLGDFQVECVNGHPYVRIYCTVMTKAKIRFSDAKAKENIIVISDYKDIQKNQDRLIFATGQNQGLWINVGRPDRAIAWWYRYKAERKNYNPLIRSFLINLQSAKKIMENCVSESYPGSKDDVRCVDANIVPNQFYIKGLAFQEMVNAATIDRFTTYCEMAGKGQKSLNELKKMIGMPNEDLKSLKLFHTSNGKETKSISSYDEMANRLSSYFKNWKNILIGQASKRDNKALRNFLLEEEIIANKKENILTNKSIQNINSFFNYKVIPFADIARSIHLEKENYLQQNKTADSDSILLSYEVWRAQSTKSKSRDRRALTDKLRRITP